MTEKDSNVMSSNRKQPHEIHNTEFVSKLMSATPAFFFTAPTSAGHNFFFSELLRSFVQKRKAEELNVAKLKAASKKPRKPVYHYQKPIEPEWKRQKLSSENQVKIATDVNENESPNMNLNENSQDSVINVDKDDSTPAPQPNGPTPATNSNTSAFYPYVDPLHFFIDLRVSAGLDRLKHNNILLDSNSLANPIIGKNRSGSAFKNVSPGSFPGSESNFSAINLITNNENSPKSFIKKNIENDDKSEEDVEVFEVEVKHDQKND